MFGRLLLRQADDVAGDNDLALSKRQRSQRAEDVVRRVHRSRRLAIDEQSPGEQDSLADPAASPSA